MKSLLGLLATLLADAGRVCSADLSRDLQEATSRCEHEGISFLTITLPTFGQAFEQCLESGRMDQTLFVGFKRRSKGSSLPAFLQGLSVLVFDTNGSLLRHPSVEAIYAVRQICYFFKKVEIPCSEKRLNKALRSYKTNDQEVKDVSLVDPELVLQLLRVRDQTIIPMLASLDKAVYEQTYLPRHGGGATAERIHGNAKYAFRTWHQRLEYYFPFSRFACPTEESAEELSKECTFLAVDEELPVRVISVPKTLKTPRIIAIEPVCMQYTQQALASMLMDACEAFAIAPYHINFRDQTINGELALSSSKSGEFSTIDLKDASDMVSNSLVKELFAPFPSLLGAIQSCRSRTAKVGDDVVHLNKFASMGSALCFPVESIVFYTIALLGCALADGRRPTDRTILSSSREVYVYGDDIVVPSRKARTVLRVLKAFGLKVNSSKTFLNGKFRESCGTDAYDGNRITPVYLRQHPTLARDDRTKLPSLVSTANQLSQKGYWKTVYNLVGMVEGILGPLPTVPRDSPVLAWIFHTGRSTLKKYDKNLQKVLTFSWFLATPKRIDTLDGYHALLKWFLKRGKDPYPSDHLNKSSRSGTSTLQRRWIGL